MPLRRRLDMNIVDMSYDMLERDVAARLLRYTLFFIRVMSAAYWR